MRVNGSERRKRPRTPQPSPRGIRLSYQIRPGVAEVVPARLIDLHEEGCGIEAGVELITGTPVLLTGDFLDPGAGKESQVRGRIAWCRTQDLRTFRAGVRFAEPAGLGNHASGGRKQDAPPRQEPASQETPDYYEVLQLSPNADQETIHRVYRLMAQRFHPDNRDTGDADGFRRVLEAYQTLSDPERRAAYDAAHQGVRRIRWKIFDQPKTAQGVEGERAKRNGILGLLYAKRSAAAEAAGMSIVEMEDLLGVPREHLEFSLWYLRENGLVTRTDNGRFSITAKGVDRAEEAGPAFQPNVRLLPEPSRDWASHPASAF